MFDRIVVSVIGPFYKTMYISNIRSSIAVVIANEFCLNILDVNVTDVAAAPCYEFLVFVLKQVVL